MIPSKTIVTLREGDSGVVVWSLQRALTDIGIGLANDGAYGKATTAAVKRFQKRIDITLDGVAGPMTQKELSLGVCARVESSYPELPLRFLEGFAASEGGFLLGAVNRSVPGGVDCSVFQRRVYTADYSHEAVVHRAFDVQYQANLLAANLTSLRASFISRAGTQDGTMSAKEKAWRLAALNHNYPAGADTLSKTPLRSLSAYWTTPASWVVAVGARFPDKVAVRTPLEWAHLYCGILGNQHSCSGGVTRYATF